ncbi:MAG: hypothetical protein ABL984_02305, partial [Pyrinomonadaceae bacterium]
VPVLRPQPVFLRAQKLVEGLAAADEIYLPDLFQAQMLALFGDGIRPHMDQIYLEAMRVRNKGLSAIAFDRNKKSVENEVSDDKSREKLETVLGKSLDSEALSDEDVYKVLNIRRDIQRRRNAIERMHRLASGFEKSPVTNEMSQTIVELADDANTAAAARAFADGATKEDFYAQMERLGIKGKEAEKLFVAGQNLLKAAREEIKQNHAEIASEVAAGSKMIESIQDAIWQAREKAHRKQNTIKAEFERLKMGKALYYATTIYTEALDLFRNLKATGEYSFVLKQAGRYLVGEPVRGLFKAAAGVVTRNGYDLKADFQEQAQVWKTLPRLTFNAETFDDIRQDPKKWLVNSFGSEQYGRIIQAIEHDPYFNEAARMGVSFSTAGKIGTGAKAGEEQLDSETAEKIPLYGKFVKKFDHAMAGFLDALRMMMYRRMAVELRRQGLDPKKDRQEFEAIARDVTRSTGRANRVDEKMPRVQQVIDGITASRLPFATSYTVSHFQVLGADAKNLTEATYKLIRFQQLPKGAQKVMLERAVSSYVGLAVTYSTMAIIFGALVSLDPDDDDFLKFKWGKYRYDVSFGLRTELRYIFRMMSSAWRGNRVPNETIYDAVAYSTRYARNKLNVLPAFTLDMILGKNVIGEKVTWSDWTRWASLVVPITYWNLGKAIKEDGMKGFMATTPEFVGISSSIYEDRAEEASTPAEKLAQKIKQMKKPWFSPTEYAEEIDNETWKEVSKVKVRSRKGEDVSADVKRLKDSGKINDRVAEDVLKAQSKSLLLETVEDARLSENEVKAVRKAANADEGFMLDTRKGSIADRLNNATTDKAVEIWNEVSERLDDQQKLEFRNKMLEKAENANKRSTLTPKEIENIKKIIPDFNIQPKAPSKPKAPNKSSVPSLEKAY